MRKIYIYVLAMLAVAFSCQRVELPQESERGNVGDELLKERVTVTFSADVPSAPDTKAFIDHKIDPNEDIKTLHLVVFDETGMLVEVSEAALLGTSEHTEPGEGAQHKDGKYFRATLSQSTKKRIIHFIANCPVGQIEHGHEASIIGNLYVKDGATAYWARKEFTDIVADPTPNSYKEDGTPIYTLKNAEAFQHIPLLRNYAEITVVDNTPDEKFIFEGFTVYNLLDRGTVAPYNNHTQEFQSFIDASGQGFTYPYFSNKSTLYEGHYLASSQMMTDLPRDLQDTSKYRIFKPDTPVYVYEKKVSVKTDEEHKWLESPPHVIVKGRYNPDPNGVAADGESYYYKVDFVYDVVEGGITTAINYYNILRNFKYQFKITSVTSTGYSKLEDAILGVASNNISGSATTTRLTDISYENGRLWVSYTDTTLVTGGAVSLKYKYVPNAFGEDPNSEYTLGQAYNDLVTIEVDTQNNPEDNTDDVITKCTCGTQDITKGEWIGYREVILTANGPYDTDRTQVVMVKTIDVNLNREVRYNLVNKYNMDVDCTQKVLPSMTQPVRVDIKLPPGLTEDMFPLELQIETWDRTLYPDVTPGKNKYPLPVVTGTSNIKDEVRGLNRQGENTFYYLLTIPTYNDYSSVTPGADNYRVFSTYWLTNLADNESVVYVYNKYFTLASDQWYNYIYEFNGVSLSMTDIPYGTGQTVDLTITRDSDDSADESRTVKVNLTGLKYNGQESFEYTINGAAATLSLETTSEKGEVAVVVDADDYKDKKVSATRSSNEFVNPHFEPSSLGTVSPQNVAFKFTIPEGRYYDEMVINVTVSDGLLPTSGQFTDVVSSTQNFTTYAFKPGKAGEHTLNFTANKSGEYTYSLKLEATAYYYETVTTYLEQLAKSYSFKSLVLPDKVTQGLGRKVDVTFAMDDSDANKGSQDVFVTLTNMTRNGDHSFTINTGNPDDVSQNANGTYTIKNIVTADVPAGTLKVSLVSSQYFEENATCSERPKQSVIESGKLILHSPDFDFNRNTNTVTLHMDDPNEQAIKELNFTRNPNRLGNRYASNQEPITIDGYDEDAVIYVKCVFTSGWNTYTLHSKCTLKQAVEGCTLELQTNVP